MSISYHGIVGFGSGKVSLPSVDVWGSNMNILRDPPKAIQTRKIDKVGETSDITVMIDDSGNRVCEAILPYARGVNPMVAVSYDNYGNNGGQKSGLARAQGLNVDGSSAKSAFLPYRIMNGGAFRPPARDQRDLLPLSRLPRVWTSSFTQPGFADYSKKMVCQSDNADDYRQIKTEDKMLKACVRPTATYKLETPIVENYQVKYVLKNPVQVAASAGIQPVAKFNGEKGTPVKEINENQIRPDININAVAERTKRIDVSSFNTEKYTQNTLHSNVSANASQNIMKKPIDEAYHVDSRKYTQDPLHSDVSANVSQDIFAQPIDEMYRVDTDQYTQDTLHTDVNSNYSQNAFVTPIHELISFDVDRHTQDVLTKDVQANASQNISVTSLDEIYGVQTAQRIKDIHNIDYTAPQKGHSKQDYIHKDLQLDRALPYHESRTNTGRNIHKRLDNQVFGKQYQMNRPTAQAFVNVGGGQRQKIDNITNRNFNLRPTIQAGGFDPTPTMPTSSRENRIIDLDAQKVKMRNAVYNLQQDRNESLGQVAFSSVYA
jgi:hypothetical protein